MKEAIQELKTKLEEDMNSATNLKKKASGELDEGFFSGLQTAYKYVIGTLEYILTKKED